MFPDDYENIPRYAGIIRGLCHARHPASNIPRVAGTIRALWSCLQCVWYIPRIAGMNLVKIEILLDKMPLL